MTTGHSLVVTAEARALRRALGPTAWAALEDLALDADRAADGTVVVPTSVRRVAENLGVSKDTAARALNRLIHAGLITRAATRHAADGTFATATYQLHDEHLRGALADTADAPPAHEVTSSEPSPSREAPRPRRQRRAAREQTSLFDLDDPVTR